MLLCCPLSFNLLNVPLTQDVELKNLSAERFAGGEKEKKKQAYHQQGQSCKPGLASTNMSVMARNDDRNTT